MKMKIEAPPHIKNLTPYVPGKPVQEVERELGLTNTVKMASNENPFGPSPKALEAGRRFLDNVHIYPEGSGLYLCQALSRHYGVAQDQVILGNGSVELIEIAAKALLVPGTNVVMSHGSFTMYRIATLAMNAEAREIPMANRTHDLEAMAKAVDSKTKMVLVANPNNPTGTYNSAATVEKLLEAVPDDVLVVIDEAYKEFVKAPDYRSADCLLGRHSNLLVLGTFAKAYGLAGLRVGYGFGHKELIAILHKARSPFNTSSIAQVAAIAALEDGDFVKMVAESNDREMKRVCAALSGMGFSFTPSVTNFLLVDVPMASSECYKKLLMEGVIIRPMEGWGFPNSIRVTLFTKEGNDRFLKALAKVTGR